MKPNRVLSPVNDTATTDIEAMKTRPHNLFMIQRCVLRWTLQKRTGLQDSRIWSSSCRKGNGMADVCRQAPPERGRAVTSPRHYHLTPRCCNLRASHARRTASPTIPSHNLYPASKTLACQDAGRTLLCWSCSVLRAPDVRVAEMDTRILKGR